MTPGDCVTRDGYDAVWLALQGAARRFRQSPTPDNLSALQEAAVAFAMVAEGYVRPAAPAPHAKRRAPRVRARRASRWPSAGEFSRARAKDARIEHHRKHAADIAEGRVPLSSGLFASVDLDDLPRLLEHRWSADPARNGWKASAWINGRRVLMHRFILDAPKGAMVDHRDLDGLNNRRLNLRFASRAQNTQNALRRPGTSRFRGVTFWKGTWEVGCGSHKTGSLRREYGFPSEETAARRYDELAIGIYGPDARLNFPKDNDDAG